MSDGYLSGHCIVFRINRWVRSVETWLDAVQKGEGFLLLQKVIFLPRTALYQMLQPTTIPERHKFLQFVVHRPTCSLDSTKRERESCLGISSFSIGLRGRTNSDRKIAGLVPLLETKRRAGELGDSESERRARVAGETRQKSLLRTPSFVLHGMQEEAASESYNSG